MMERNVSGTRIELVRGDIVDQPDMEAIVNAANAALRAGGGVAGAIHRAAGPGLEQECRPLAPIRPGQAVITGAHNLPNVFVIHCLGPVFGVDQPADRLLADCYRNALQVAEENGVSSVAFPAISTGAFGFPMEPAARIALATILAEAPMRPEVRRIRFVLYGREVLDLHAKQLAERTRDEPESG